MSRCKECKFFFAIPAEADDFEPGKGDCVREERDDKGKYWSARPVAGEQAADKCGCYQQRLGG